MRVFITGGSGLIGRRMIGLLTDRGTECVVLSRRAAELRINSSFKGVEIVQGDPTVESGWDKAIDGCDAVVNLVGHNIFADRWTADVKRKIRDSRVISTENVVAAMKRCASPPKTLVSGSAIGYYGFHGDEELTEKDPCGSDFMALICKEWEDAARRAEGFGVRTASVRTGVVLAKGEGALGVMTPIFRLLGGSPVGGGKSPFSPASGKQWFSWIHLDDIVGIFIHALDRADASGPINGTAPVPVTNADFSRALTETLRRLAPTFGTSLLWPRYIPIGPPDFMMGLILGEVAQVIAKGQKVLPKRARELGYTFKFSQVEAALTNLFTPPVASSSKIAGEKAAAGEPVAV